MRARALTTAALTVSAALVPVLGNALPSNAEPAPIAWEPRPGSVTLITGDRVEPQPGGEPRIVPALDRKDVRFRITREGGHLHVVPIDAVPLIVDGRLDSRLFDIDALIDAGYADDKRTDLGLIVRYAPGPRQQTVRQDRALPSVGGGAAGVAKVDTPALWRSLRDGRSGLANVWLNGRRQPTLDRSVSQIGAPVAWQQGLTGDGVEVAVLDTGIDATHPDLVGRVAGSRNFTSRPDSDEIGHGTHVASIIASNGTRYRGVAPGARLLDGKVCELRGCQEDAILAGMEWAAAERHAPVVNMSLGSQDTPGSDPMETAIEALSAQYGTLFVVAAGNEGPNPGTVGTPGSADAALTVGAVDGADTIAPFSSRGPRLSDSALKPDLTAPGVAVVAAQAAGTELGTPTGDGHVTASGTSMATPHVTGAAAILRQRHPDWTGAQLKAALMASAKPIGAAYEHGAGRVDVARADTQQVTASPTSVSFGLALWPHEDDQVLSRKVGYRNDGPADVALGVVAPAPFTVTPSSVTVPSGGTAEVTVTVDTRSASVPVGTHSGQIVATGAGVSVSTPVGVEKEAERYTVTFTHISRDGTPGLHTTFADRVGDCGDDVSCGGVTAGTDATTSLRLPPGEYVLGELSTADRTDTTLLVQPKFVLSKDTAVTLDARIAKPVEVRAPRGTAMGGVTAVGVNPDRPNRAFTYVLGAGESSAPVYVGTVPGSPPTQNRIYSIVQAKFAEPGPDGDFMDSPYVYNLAAAAPDQVFDGVRLAPRPDEFATVEASYASVSDAPRQAKVDHAGKPPQAPKWLSIPPVSQELPSSRMPLRRTEFYLADGLSWWTLLSHRSIGDPRNALDLADGQHRPVYQAGRTYRKDWNKGVLGPAFDEPDLTGDAAQPARGSVRTGDRVDIGLITAADATHVHDPRLPLGSGRLLRDGVVVAQWPEAGFMRTTLPPEPATYQLEHSARSGADISTEITNRWMFRSGHTSGPEALPLMAVRFTPELDDYNHARPGRFKVPVAVQRQPGASESTVDTPSVEVSYDDGATWRRAPITGGKVIVDNPKGAAVSLRATAVDRAGNRVEQTILRAYLVRG